MPTDEQILEMANALGLFEYGLMMAYKHLGSETVKIKMVASLIRRGLETWEGSDIVLAGLRERPMTYMVTYHSAEGWRVLISSSAGDKQSSFEETRGVAVLLALYAAWEAGLIPEVETDAKATR